MGYSMGYMAAWEQKVVLDERVNLEFHAGSRRVRSESGACADEP